MSTLTERATRAVELKQAEQELDNIAATKRQQIALQDLARREVAERLQCEIDEFYDVDKITRYTSEIMFRVEDLQFKLHGRRDRVELRLWSSDPTVWKAMLGSNYGDIIDVLTLGKALAHYEGYKRLDIRVKP